MAGVGALLALSVCTPELVAQERESVLSESDTGRKVIRAFKLTQPMRVDGRLDEDIYERIAPLTSFVQTLPDEGDPITERTEAWVLYDENNIYVSCRCWESVPPDQWTANEFRRDTNQLRQNDLFGALFDTFHDRRNGFNFYTNPLGAIADQIVTDEGNPNVDWNPIWEVRTGRFEGGWTAELAIPFKSLRYRSGTNQTWGIQLRRGIRRKNEYAYLSPVPAAAGGVNAIFRVSDAADLVALDLPAAGKNIEIKPYAISRVSSDLLSTTPFTNDLSGDVGVDAKYAVTANLIADFTYNTDFAQVEIDEQQVNLTRFSLFFPEKREFFLEGRGIFEFGRSGGFGGGGGGGGSAPSVFYSRRIGLQGSQVIPINGGGRLTGKVGRSSIGVMSIQTAEVNPPTIGGLAPGVPSTNFSVVRVKQDVLRRSSIGAIVTNRSDSAVVSGVSNQAYGADATFAFYDNLNINGYVAETRTPGLVDDDRSFQGRFNYNGDRYGAVAEYLHVGDNFNPEVGFVRRDDMRRSAGSLRFSPRPQSIDWVRRFTWEGNIEYIENGAGVLETRVQTGRFNIEFENSDQFSVDGNFNYEFLDRATRIAGVLIPAGGYSFDDWQVRYQMGQQRRFSGALTYSQGGFYDGTIRAYGLTGARLSITPRLSVEPSVSVNQVTRAGDTTTSNVYRARIDYGFSPRMFVSGLLQYGTSDEIYSSNFRFRWEYRPGSELFLVYTDERDAARAGYPDLRNRAFVVKINRLWRY